MTRKARNHPSTELFRFARISPTAIVDIEHRIQLRGLPRDPAKRVAWAKGVLGKDASASRFSDLSFPYADYLDTGVDVEAYVPARRDLRDSAAFEKAAVADDQRYVADLSQARDTLIALALDSDADAVRRSQAARLVQFLEAFPQIAQTSERKEYAPLVMKRVGRIATPRPKEPTKSAAVKQVEAAIDLRKMADAVRTVWQARNAHIQALNRAQIDVRRRRAALVPVAMPVATGVNGVPLTGRLTAQQRRAAAAAEMKARAAAKKARDVTSKARVAANEAIDDAGKKYENARLGMSLGAILEKHDGLTKGVSPEMARGLVDAVGTIKDFSGKYGIPVVRYCEAYGAALEKLDQTGVVHAPAGLGSGDADEAGFESPLVTFADSVRVLGKAELVRVDEEFVRYAAGEISYIQTVLKGEKLKREVRSENTNESSTEQLRDELVERGQETSATTKAELKNEVESELRTRMETSVNASGNASGGGTIGVVDVSGSASVGATVGVDVEAATRMKNASQFAQEIVQKGLERTTRRTMERRLTRTVQTYAALDLHEIDNTGGDMMNGTYVFLNKRVAIKETTYGARAFLEAKLLTPGRTLVAARTSRVRTAEDAIGAKPMFTITPADITPANYMRLAGEFRGQNVEPPPSPITRVTRVYKTDTATAVAEKQEFNGKKIADILVPFFGQYQRFLITDNVELPEGYEVADVDVAVSHGANGVSIPAHLPFTLPTTAAYAGVSFTPFVLGITGIALLPAWVWSVGFMASPLLHYNADSSNVTITVGTEGMDSAYFFFEPDELLNEVIALLEALTILAPGVIGQMQSMANTTIAKMLDAAKDVPPEIAGKVTAALTTAVNSIKEVLDHLSHGRLNRARDAFLSVSAPTITMDDLASVPTVFAPMTQFVTDLGSIVTAQAAEVISQAFGVMLTRLNNNQNLSFFACEGTRGRLPLAINAMALKPGITVSASICLRRTDEALARWQLRTFESFYQGHLQLVAAYENRLYQRDAAAEGRAPAFLRREEHAALKERILHAINGLHDTSPLTYDIEKLALFEHALDWENMSYRLFNYGPSSDELRFERLGVLLGSDDRRRMFLTATWAEVMIPVQPHEGLEAQILGYFGDGSGSIDAAIPPGDNRMNELAALYRDLVLSRALGESGEPTITYAWVPTDLIALYKPDLAANLPRNPDYLTLDP